jgi:hypothetical protein
MGVVRSVTRHWTAPCAPQALSALCRAQPVCPYVPRPTLTNRPTHTHTHTHMRTHHSCGRSQHRGGRPQACQVCGRGLRWHAGDARADGRVPLLLGRESRVSVRALRRALCVVRSANAVVLTQGTARVRCHLPPPPPVNRRPSRARAPTGPLRSTCTTAPTATTVQVGPAPTATTAQVGPTPRR